MKTVKLSDLIIEYDNSSEDCEFLDDHPILSLCSHNDKLRVALLECTKFIMSKQKNNKDKIFVLELAASAIKNTDIEGFNKYIKQTLEEMSNANDH